VKTPLSPPFPTSRPEIGIDQTTPARSKEIPLHSSSFFFPFQIAGELSFFVLFAHKVWTFFSLRDLTVSFGVRLFYPFPPCLFPFFPPFFGSPLGFIYCLLNTPVLPPPSFFLLYPSPNTVSPTFFFNLCCLGMAIPLRFFLTVTLPLWRSHVPQ